MPSTPQPRGAARRLTGGLSAAAAALAAAVAVAATALPAGAVSAHPGSGRTVDVQLLSFNDLHGNLEPPQRSAATVQELQPDGSQETIPAGGGAYLAQALRRAPKGNPYSH